MRTVLSPEAEFLLLCAGGSRNDGALRILAAGPFDWHLLATMAEADGATTVVWRRIQRVGCAVPKGVAEELHRATVLSEFQLLRARARLSETVAAFGRGGIRVVLLKGAALAETVYDSFTDRPMRDFDLLVDERRVDEAESIAVATGWTRSAGAASDAAYAAHHHLAPLVDTRGTQMHLELHTSLFNAGSPFELSPGLIRQRSRPVDIDGCLVGVPARSLLLLHACLHFAWSHSMQSAGWRTMRDVGQLVGSSAPRWEEFTRMAIAARAQTCCYWTLRLARDLAKVSVPNEVLAALQAPLPEMIRSRLARHFALHLFARDASCPSSRLEARAWDTAIQPGWSGHGPARPWDRSSDFLDQGPTSAPTAAAGSGLARHLDRIPAWQRYLRFVLLGGATPS